MKKSFRTLLAGLLASWLPLTGLAQVNSGSDGHDGALNPTSNLVIDMADHPDGIYHYTSVNIPAGVTVSFIPNAGNKPVVWLVQGSCMIQGTVSVDGVASTGIAGAPSGPGGFAGGNGSLGPEAPAGAGVGPGGGMPSGTGNPPANNAGHASFGTVGERVVGSPQSWNIQAEAGSVYGSTFLVPLLGGSGGAGSDRNSTATGGGGGGAGAILIAAGGEIQIVGEISAEGGDGSQTPYYNQYTGGGAGGSGGAIRLVAQRVTGGGSLFTYGGNGIFGYSGGYLTNRAGQGRIRVDAQFDQFNGQTAGIVTRGFQPIIIPPANQGVSLAIQSVGGVAVAATPIGQLTSPDVIIPAHQQNPVSIVVHCMNIPLSTGIIVDVKPANGATVRVVGLNTVGTQASSTATVQVNMPRGGGTIQAKAVSGIALAAANGANNRARSLAESGWTADGERFTQVEVTATLDDQPRVAYITESGKRYPAN